MNIERLEKIATHLETGKLGHDTFDFMVVNSALDTCGTNGCAMGEFPIIFKNDWRFKHGGVELINTSYRMLEDPRQSNTVAIYLDLTPLDTRFLFFPRNIQFFSFVGEKMLLSWDSTRYRVATRIRRFIDYKLHHTLDAREAQAKQDRDFKITQRAMRMRMIRAHEAIRGEYEKVCDNSII